MPARLKDIVEALEMQFDEYPSFLDCETYEVVTVSRDLLREAEDGGDEEDEEEEEEPDLPGGQDDEWETAKLIVSTDRFLRLPSDYDVHEWAIMEDFSRSVKSGRIREDLLHALRGSGAFRYFKDVLRRHSIEQAWYAYRTEALRQIALDWCEENHIVWE